MARTYGDGADETITFTTVGDTVTASALLADIDEELGDFDVPDSATTTVSWWVTFADSASNADVTDADAGAGFGRVDGASDLGSAGRAGNLFAMDARPVGCLFNGPVRANPIDDLMRRSG